LVVTGHNGDKASANYVRMASILMARGSLMRYEVRQQCVGVELTTAVLRAIHRDIEHQGLSPGDLRSWAEESCWFPGLRGHSSVIALREALPAEWRVGQPCEPQILMDWPNEYEGQLWPHLDQEPHWAEGRKYSDIVCVPLIPWTVANGTVIIFEGGEAREAVELRVGDVLWLNPTTPHSRGVNRSGLPRFGVYYRWLSQLRSSL
jgi:hypothetical protein